MRYSIIMNCYNTLSLVQRAVGAALNSTSHDAEIILVNNHPPYPDVLHYLQHLRHPRIRVLDPGRNLGCTPGFQYGAEHAAGEFIIKLDDDTIVPNNNWTLAMEQALTEFPDLAYVALALPIYQLGKTPPVARAGYVIEFSNDTVLFSCMMIRKSLWRQHFIINETGLYGGEEWYYQQKANALGLRKAYILSHQCEHLGRTRESDPLYGAWKVFYGYSASTRQEYSEWRMQAVLGPGEINILKQVGYPDDQIEEIRVLLDRIKTGQ